MRIWRKGATCDPCCNDWKEKIKFLWERYREAVRSVKLNGTVHWPDGEGQIDLGEIQGSDMEIPTTSGVNGWTENNPVTLQDFVNSSIATNTANYISDNGQPFTSAADLPTTGVTNNDYAFVTGTDAAGNTFYDRYKATVSNGVVTWALEYRLNNSSFTAQQWAAIQSGITSALVANYNAYAAQIAAKQDKLDTQVMSISSSSTYTQVTDGYTTDFLLNQRTWATTDAFIFSPAPGYARKYGEFMVEIIQIDDVLLADEKVGLNVKIMVNDIPDSSIVINVLHGVLS